MKIYDCHCHSEHSHDSKQTVRQIAESAIELGFSGVAITNHYDYLTPGVDVSLIERERDNILLAFGDICALKEEYADRIELFCGAELGSPFLAKDRCDTVISDTRADVIIGSAHVVTPIYNDGSLRDYNPFREREPTEADRIVEAYFTDIYRNIAFCDIDIVGHISYLQRYIVKGKAAPFDFDRYIDACADIMRAAVNHSKAIEINAKSIDVCKNSPFNETAFFKLYRSLGGELVTIGTDSHAPEQFSLASKANELLKSVGFKYACYYKGRQPIFYSLD